MRLLDLATCRWTRRLALLVLLTGVVLAVSGLLGATAHAGVTSRSAWRWPVQPAVVLRGFSADQQPYGPGHDGVDLVASPGDAVHSAADGVVTFVGMVAGRPLVVVQHAGDLRTTYEPVRPGVVRGESVRAGQTVGYLADRPWHCGWRACLHWGVRLGQTYIDPLTLLDRGPPRLLPLWSNLPSSSTWVGRLPSWPTPPPATARPAGTGSSNTGPSNTPVVPLALAGAVAVGGGFGIVGRSVRVRR